MRLGPSWFKKRKTKKENKVTVTFSLELLFQNPLLKNNVGIRVYVSRIHWCIFCHKMQSLREENRLILMIIILTSHFFSIWLNSTSVHFDFDPSVSYFEMCLHCDEPTLYK